MKQSRNWFDSNSFNTSCSVTDGSRTNALNDSRVDMILTQDVDLMMSDGVATEHTDERSIVSDSDIHNDETVVTG